uniref:Hydroxysteroid dehydrogenase-like protein 2 n=1 Tax=Strigamia maritima TaxID=126957 RepID=T1JL64_STRMM
MLNTGKLAGKTIFITGASRGIGKSIALKAAKDGANVVIAAKTAQPHPKLPGTIYTAAKEVEEAGGHCLPCIVDIRIEEQIQKAVDETVKKFGGIDILVNNASAISLTGTLDTDMKRYDLMHNINTRGTFLTSKYCIPYLKKGKNSHILNLSPPLNMNPFWFKGHVAYTMAKYGMSMCVLGMAEELKEDRIAVNALWPKTAIHTAAMEMLGGNDIGSQCRTPEIVADAAYVILTKDSRNFTGNFCIDEDILKQVGVKDFTNYAVKPGTTLMPDFFLDVAEQTQTNPSPSGVGQVASVFNAIQGLLTNELVQNVNSTYTFNLTGTESGKWYIDLKSGNGKTGKGEYPDGKADVIFTMDSNDFHKMFNGTLKTAPAFMTGKLKLTGDMGRAMKLEKLLGQMKSKL